MHFDFVFMHHLLGPCVMQLISRFNRRFGVIERCCHDRVVTKEPWTTRRRTPVVAVVMLLHTTLGSKWNPSIGPYRIHNCVPLTIVSDRFTFYSIYLYR